MGTTAVRGGGGSGPVAGEDAGMMNARCGKCSGWLYREKVMESWKTILWEWTCITCGQTYYPEDGKVLQGNIPGRQSAGKYSR